MQFSVLWIPLRLLGLRPHCLCPLQDPKKLVFVDGMLADEITTVSQKIKSSSGDGSLTAETQLVTPSAGSVEVASSIIVTRVLRILRRFKVWVGYRVLCTFTDCLGLLDDMIHLPPTPPHSGPTLPHGPHPSLSIVQPHPSAQLHPSPNMDDIRRNVASAQRGQGMLFLQSLLLVVTE